MTTTQHKNIGLIGLSAKPGSWAGRAHIHYFNEQSHYKITALQNSSKESAEAAAKAHNLEGVSAHGSIDTLVKDPNVDIVAVSVNVPAHFSLVKPALEAGKDVFVEWPLARNLPDAELLTSLAKEKGVKTSVGLQARQNPSILKAKEYVQSGKLGKILNTTMYGHGMILGPTTNDKYEYLSDINNGANILTIPAGHAIDALCFVLGELESVSAMLSTLRKKVKVVDEEGKEVKEIDQTSHDQIAITGPLVNGGGLVSVVYAGGSSRTGRDFHWEINGTEGSLVLEGPSGHIQMAQPTLKFISNDAGAKLETVEVEDANHPKFAVGRAWDAWAGKGIGSVTTFENALLRHRMIDAVYKSAKEGRVQRYL
ncbi:NAD-binding Rossmann fold oxidoreductase family protein [Delitschia confertaspora ATCC 74209]|uniref:NAD-binding Rossmann fold oxidoreductase family protein n=1 Tax=Delitschia confertaspora ATCC 74209 TaxID=1513339 RepID=A0A9P4MRJ5_9PLEO|nr:NAD-binding Rossmann fold oxidoreductase family protein [Delitschia confertaspora ATCC 74209]